MTYIYILAPIGLGLILTLCSTAYCLYIRYSKNKLVKKIRQRVLTERCGQVYATKLSGTSLAEKTKTSFGIYREPYAYNEKYQEKPYLYRDPNIYGGSNDTGFYSTYSGNYRTHSIIENGKFCPHKVNGPSSRDMAGRPTVYDSRAYMNCHLQASPPLFEPPPLPPPRLAVGANNAYEQTDNASCLSDRPHYIKRSQQRAH